MGDATRSGGAERGAIFVLPATTVGQQGPVAAWISTAGWASAARRVLGTSWIVTPRGVVGIEEARRRGSLPHLAPTPDVRWRRRIPTPAKIAVKDVRQWHRARRFRVAADGPWRGTPVRFVWQRHELFHHAGLALAHDLGVPSVLFVPAPLVWESEQWGVRRPGWSTLLERVGERPALTAADLVACGSEPVAEQLSRLGVQARRILVTPTGVDLDAFDETVDGARVRRRLGLEGRFVVGWLGSFRRFHALDQLVDAVAGVDDVTLLMVGDGPERPGLEDYAAQRGVRAVFTGTVAHVELAAHLSAMDVGVVLGEAGETFHYSPLKLAEYLAAGLAVVAPRIPQVEQRLTDGIDAALVPRGDTAALGARIRELRDDPELRESLGAAARVAAEKAWSWDHQVERILDALEALGHRAPAGT